MIMIQKILLHPPKWLKRILELFPAYRQWYINQVVRMLREDAFSDLFKK